VRSCKRRNQAPVGRAGTSIGRVFSVNDEYNLLEERAVVSSVRSRITNKGLYLLDAFRGFDVDCNGALDATELYSGLKWLGLDVKPDLVYFLIKTLDLTGEGTISFFEFKAVFDHGRDESKIVKGEYTKVEVPQFKIAPPPWLQKKENPKKRKLCSADFKFIIVKVDNVDRFKHVYNSKGAGSRSKVSVWRPETEFGFFEKMFKKDRKKLCVGHYASKSYKHPKNDACFMVEVRDNRVAGISGSDVLSSAIEKFFPHPKRFHEIWSKKHRRGKKAVHAWMPVPPGPAYTAIGVMITDSPTPPNVNDVHCVPKAWLKETSKDEIKQQWDDTGGGGRPGSFWRINSLGLLGVNIGHNAPKGPHYEFKQKEFNAAQFPVQV